MAAIKQCSKCAQLKAVDCQFIDECPHRIETVLNTRINGVDKAISDLDRVLTLAISELEKRFNENTESIQQSTNLKAEVIEKRLETMNEFRNALKDQAGTFFTRPEHDLYMKAVEADLRVLREDRANAQGMAKQSSVMWAYAFSALAALASVVSIVLHFLK